MRTRTAATLRFYAGAYVPDCFGLLVVFGAIAALTVPRMNPTYHPWGIAMAIPALFYWGVSFWMDREEFGLIATVAMILAFCLSLPTGIWDCPLGRPGSIGLILLCADRCFPEWSEVRQIRLSRKKAHPSARLPLLGDDSMSMDGFLQRRRAWSASVLEVMNCLPCPWRVRPILITLISIAFEPAVFLLRPQRAGEDLPG